MNALGGSTDLPLYTFPPGLLLRPLRENYGEVVDGTN